MPSKAIDVRVSLFNTSIVQRRGKMETRWIHYIQCKVQMHSSTLNKGSTHWQPFLIKCLGVIFVQERRLPSFVTPVKNVRLSLPKPWQSLTELAYGYTHTKKWAAKGQSSNKITRKILVHDWRITDSSSCAHKTTFRGIYRPSVCSFSFCRPIRLSRYLSKIYIIHGVRFFFLFSSRPPTDFISSTVIFPLV